MQQYTTDSAVSYDDWYERGQARVRNIAVGIAAAIVIAVVVGGLILWHRHTHPPIVPAPLGFTTYNAPDGGFQVAQPQGWTTDASSSMATDSGIKFKNGPCKIIVSSDLSGSLMADIAQSQNTQQQNIASEAGLPASSAPAVVPPVEKLHLAGKEDMTAAYPGYLEQPMQTFQCAAGPAKVSEFTSDTGGSAPIDHLHGYRATILSNQRRITVVEVCPEQNWSILVDSFRKVLESVAVPTQ